MSATVTGHPRNNLRGVVLMLAAVSFLSLMDAVLKELAAHYPPMQVSALRGLSSWPLVLVWIAASSGFATLLRVRWPLHLLRGAIGIIMMAAFVYAIRELPLSTAYTLFFIAPMLITVLSAPVLGERVGAGRALAVGAGFVGVLVALRPTGEGMLTWSSLAVLLAAAGYAVSALTVQVLARTDSTQAMVFWLLSFLAVGATALAAAGWVPIRREDWWLIAALGIVGTLGQYCITEAFRHGEASVLAPLEYTALAWAVGFDLLIWGVLPDAWTWAGAAIIIAGGLYLIRHERRGAPAADAVPSALAPVKEPEPAGAPGGAGKIGAAQ